MNLNEIRENVNYRLNKDYTGLAYTPEQFNLVLPLVNIEKFKQLYGLPEEYQKGATYARVEWEASRKISDDLRPFLVSMDGKNTPKLTVNTLGIATLPSDYQHASSLSFDYIVNNESKRKPITILKNAEFDYREGSALVAPTKKRPVCTFKGNEIHFLPKDIRRVKFDYLRLPATPYYATTEDPDTEELVYDHANSVQLEWSETVQADIIAMLVKYAAENLGMMQNVQLSEIRKDKGV